MVVGVVAESGQSSVGMWKRRGMQREQGSMETVIMIIMSGATVLHLRRLLLLLPLQLRSLLPPLLPLLLPLHPP